MNLFNSIKDNTIIICENNYKKSILKKLSNTQTFLNVKFYTKKEFIQNNLFTYDNKTIYYLVKKYNYKIDVAKLYINNIYYIDNKIYKSDKLNFLVNLKKELDDNKLLIYNNFYNLYKSYNILIIGYSYLEEYELNIFNKYNYTIYEENNNNGINEVYEFKNQVDEINYVCKSISKLLDNNISINNIKLVGINKDYYNDLDRMCNFYNIPIKLDTNNNLYSNPIAKKFLNSFDNIDSFLEEVKDYDKDIINKIINIYNKYTFINELSIKKDFIIYDFKNTIVNNFHYKNYLEIKDIYDYFDEKDYIFLLNFNNGFTPISIKDEDYISDSIKKEVNLKETYLVNTLNKEYYIKKLFSIKNKTITYKLEDQFGECYPSSLINELNLTIKKEDKDIFNSYSYIYDKICYANMEDNFNKYGIIDNNYYLYKNSIKDNNYNTYDNKYKLINTNSLKEYLNNKLVLSYSSLNNYNKCAFRYYIANILKLDKYEDSFEAFIGSLFHDVLEKTFNNNLDVDLYINEYLKKQDRVYSIKERYFINKISNDIKFVINVLNIQKKYTILNNSMLEKNIIIDKSKDMNIYFIGYIDKLLYQENENNTLVSIIDYKTGNIGIDLKYVKYGFGLQLPIYLYLVKKSNIFNNPTFIGFYLQYILNKNILKDNKSSYNDKRIENLKLVGYSNSDQDLLCYFDNNYNNSSLIKGMKCNSNNSFSAYAKVLSNEEIDKLIDITEENIDNAIDKITKADFSINPKKIKDINVGCEYCKFKDICFVKENDYIILDDVDSLDYLRGDEVD